MERVIIETFRQCYAFSQVDSTMTVGELIAALQEYDEDAKIYLSYDNRYTVSGITSGMIEAEEADEDEE
jgi:hypothetical protein